MFLTHCLTLAGTAKKYAMASCLACWGVIRRLLGYAAAAGAAVYHRLLPAFGGQ